MYSVGNCASFANSVDELSVLQNDIREISYFYDVAFNLDSIRNSKYFHINFRIINIEIGIDFFFHSYTYLYKYRIRSILLFSS